MNAQSLANRIVAALFLAGSMALLLQYLPGWNRGRDLDADRAGFTDGRIVSVETRPWVSSKSGKTLQLSRIHYAYTVGGVDYGNTTECSDCSALGGLQEGQGVRVRYRRAEPGASRLDAWGDTDRSGDRIVVGVCAVIALLAAFILAFGRWPGRSGRDAEE